MLSLSHISMATFVHCSGLWTFDSSPFANGGAVIEEMHTLTAIFAGSAFFGEEERIQ